MKNYLSIALVATLMSAAPQAFARDTINGTILALDRKAGLLVLTDRSVWALEALKSPLPKELKAGDRIEIVYQSDEEGVSDIEQISLLPPPAAAASTGSSGGEALDISEGAVIAYDRKANVLVLKDRTVWALELLESPVPAGVKNGDRVRIEYQSDEEGVSAIKRIEILSD